MARPSIEGCCSSRMSSFSSSATRFNSDRPFCWCTASRPRNLTVSLTLSPLPMNWRTLRSFGVEVVGADVGAEPDFLQLVAFLGFAGLALFLGREIPEFAVVQQPARPAGRRWAPLPPGQGSFIRALERASDTVITPSCSPSSPITRTRGTRICSLTLYCLAMATPP